MGEHFICIEGGIWRMERGAEGRIVEGDREKAKDKRTKNGRVGQM